MFTASARNGGNYVKRYVRLSLLVYLSDCRPDNSKRYEWILMKLRVYGRVGHGPRRNWLDFGGDLASTVNSTSQSRVFLLSTNWG